MRGEYLRAENQKTSDNNTPNAYASIVAHTGDLVISTVRKELRTTLNKRGTTNEVAVQRNR